MAAPSPLRVLLVGVSPEDLDRLLRLTTAEPLMQIVGATLLDTRTQIAGSGIAHDAVLLTPEALTRLEGVRNRHTPAEPPAEALTPRERDVLGHAAEGLGNREIGALLGISEHTVKFHLASIYGKLAVGNRTEAVQHALRMGILEI